MKRNINPADDAPLHGNPNTLMYTKYLLINACASIKALATGPSTKAQDIYARYKGPVLQTVISDAAIANYALFFLFIANYFFGSWAHRNATMTTNGRSVYDKLPKELYIGSHRNHDQQLIGTQECSMVRTGLFSTATKYAFHGDINQNVRELLEFACGLLERSVTIGKTEYPEKSICTGVSGSPDHYTGIRNDGLTDLFFTSLQRKFKMPARLWVNCESDADSNFLSHIGFTLLDYGSYLASVALTLYAVFKVLEYAYDFAHKSWENFKEWRANQMWEQQNPGAMNL